MEARLSAAAVSMLDAFDVVLFTALAPVPSLPTSPAPRQAASPSQPSSPTAAAAASATRTPLAACPSPLTRSLRDYRASVVASRIAPSSLAAVTAGSDASAHSSSGGAGATSAASSLGLGQAAVAFDDLWLKYLDQFVAWKSHDAGGSKGHWD